MVIEKSAYVPGEEGAIGLNLHLRIEMVFLHHMNQFSDERKTKERLSAGKLEEKAFS